MEGMTIGKRIKMLLVVLGITQKQMADLLDIDRSRMNKIANGKRSATTWELIMVSRHLGVPVEYLIGEDGRFRLFDSMLETLYEKGNVLW